MKYDIPNILDINEFHSTVVYSRVKFQHIPSSLEFTAYPKTIKIFNEKVLTIELDSIDLNKRHSEIYSNNPKATYDFENYIPHITVSYDISDINENNLQYINSKDFIREIKEQIPIISNGKEYTKTLDLDKFK